MIVPEIEIKIDPPAAVKELVIHGIAGIYFKREGIIKSKKGDVRKLQVFITALQPRNYIRLEQKKK